MSDARKELGAARASSDAAEDAAPQLGASLGGRWAAHDEHGYWAVFEEESGSLVADLGVSDFVNGQDREHARLIAAAPELLACAHKSVEPYEGISNTDLQELYGEEEAQLVIDTREAISKAEGAS